MRRPILIGREPQSQPEAQIRARVAMSVCLADRTLIREIPDRVANDAETVVPGMVRVQEQSLVNLTHDQESGHVENSKVSEIALMVRHGELARTLRRVRVEMR